MNNEAYRLPGPRPRQHPPVVVATSPFACRPDDRIAAQAAFRGPAVPQHNPRLATIVRDHIADGFGATLVAAEADLGRRVEPAELRAAARHIPMAELRLSLKLSASIGAQ